MPHPFQPSNTSAQSRARSSQRTPWVAAEPPAWSIVSLVPAMSALLSCAAHPGTATDERLRLEWPSLALRTWPLQAISEHPQLGGLGHCSSSRRAAELGVDVRHVAVDGVPAQSQRVGDILVPHSPGDQPQYLPLAARQGTGRSAAVSHEAVEYLLGTLP